MRRRFLAMALAAAMVFSSVSNLAINTITALAAEAAATEAVAAKTRIGASDCSSAFYAEHGDFYEIKEGKTITIKEAPAGYSADGTGSVTKAVVRTDADPATTGPAITSSSELGNPTTDSDGVTTWDCIYFGNYWQNDTNGDGTADQNDDKEPIKWRVLSVDGDDAFLLADQNLDCQPYNEEDEDVTWETCTLRTWLNSTFLSNAFSEEEQAVIEDTTVVNEDNPYYGTEGGNNTTDQVYLLSMAEACNTAYGFRGALGQTSETREAKNTAYAKACGACTEMSTGYWGNGYWWLRSPGGNSNDAASVITAAGATTMVTTSTVVLTPSGPLCT